jgi:hypothetical protein
MGLENLHILGGKSRCEDNRFRLFREAKAAQPED